MPRFPHLMLVASHNSQHFSLSVLPDIIPQNKKGESGEKLSYMQVQAVLQSHRKPPKKGDAIKFDRRFNNCHFLWRHRRGAR